jgi:hypothetical protein
MVTVEFRQKSEGTEILLSQENFKNEDSAEIQKSGWLQALDSLAKGISEGQI